MKKGFYVVFAVLFLLFYCGYGYAADFSVSTAADFQSALNDAAANGEDDTITLEAGTYSVVDNGDVFTYSAASGEGFLTLLANGEVILDGENSEQVLSINNYDGTDVTLEGLTMKNSDSIFDGGGA